MDTNATPKGEEFIDMPRYDFWSMVIFTPVFVWIASMAIEGNFAEDTRGWLIAGVVAAMIPGGYIYGRLAIRLRRKMEAPVWWTMARHNNMGHALALAAFWAACMVSVPTTLPAALVSLMLWWGVMIPPMFAVCEAVDWGMARVGQLVGFRTPRG